MINRIYVGAYVTVFTAILSVQSGLSQSAAPVFASTDTPKGNKGDSISFSGQSLQKALISKIFLTDGKNDFQVEVLEQTATTVKFRIPDTVPPGHYAQMLFTTKPEYIGLTRFKIDIDQHRDFQIVDTDKEKMAVRKACQTVYDATADKKLVDLTVREEQAVRDCQKAGLYPPR